MQLESDSTDPNEDASMPHVQRADVHEFLQVLHPWQGLPFHHLSLCQAFENTKERLEEKGDPYFSSQVEQVRKLPTAPSQPNDRTQALDPKCLHLESSLQVFGRWKQHSRFTTYCHARKLLVRPHTQEGISSVVPLEEEM